MNQNKKAYFFAGIAVFFWSTVATAFKLALRDFDFIQLIFYTSLVTVVVLFILLLSQRKIKKIFQQTRKQWLYSMLIGAFNPLLYYLVLFKAYSLLPAQLAQPLNMVWPIVLVLLSVPLLHQKISWLSVIALLVSFSGVVFITSQGGISGFKNTSATGAFLALGSSVIWALYWIFNVRDTRDEIVKLFLNFSFGFVYLALAVALFSDFTVDPSKNWGAIVYIGFFETGLTYVFWLKAMQATSHNAKIGNLVFLSPFVSLIFIHFILKETIFVTTFIGLAFIVGGIFIQQLEKKKS
ncbi:MAG: DMT family transporter [Prolixibacteraceae bacterium]|nr:DMT family transporter [Prolixibacteraceae bacterium]